MKSPLKHERIEFYLTIGFISLALLLLYGAVITYQNGHRILSTGREIANANQVLYHVEMLRGEIGDMRGNTRAYIITANPKFAELPDTILSSTAARVAALRKMVHHEPRQLARLDSLFAFAQIAINENIYMSNLVKEGKQKEAMQFAWNDEVMDRANHIKWLSEEMKEEERAELAKLQNNFTGGQKFFMLAFILRSIFIPLILLVVYLIIRFYLRSLRKTETELRQNITGLQDKEKQLMLRSEQLQAANKELESFTYSVSHDLRSPVRAIHGYTQILKDDYGSHLNEDAKEVMSIIILNARKMGQLIDDLLRFSRLGRQELQMNEFSMTDLVTDVSEELKTNEGNRVIEYNIKNLHAAKADRVIMKQVWINLISNALKYCKQKEKTEIEIGSEENDHEFIYYIKDNGAGFDMRYYDKLFGVFQRLHGEEEFEGTGVGLAIVQRIITKHGGRVWAEGKVNEGATFSFSLPKN